MKQRELDKQELDRIGRNILAAARLSEAEIEAVAGAPNLLTAVRAGIEAERATARKNRARAVRFDFKWRAAFVSLAVLVALTMLAIAFVRQSPPSETAVKRPSPVIEPAAPEPLKDARAYVQNPPDEADADTKLRNPFEDFRPKPEKASFKPAAPPKAKPAREPRPGKPSPRTNDGDGVFYALPYAGHTETEDLRIVRTELSPKSLFALGVNVSVENESAKIKTDLLVGADGQARAIRFVR